MRKDCLAFALIVAAAIAAGGISWWVTKQKVATSEVTESKGDLDLPNIPAGEADQATGSATVGEATPSGSAIEADTPEPQNSETTEGLKSDKELIRDAMAEKYKRDPEAVYIVLDKNTGAHALGSVTFAGEFGGGWFLAAKDEGEWLIAADGNGAIPCEEIEPYNFPTSMVPECFDEATSQLKKR